MKKIIVSLLVLFFCVKSFGQSTITQTYIDPCDNKVYVVTIPFGQNSTVAVIRGKSKIVTISDISSGAFQVWVNSVFSTPCSTQSDAIKAAQEAAAKAAADAAARAAADAAAKAAADAAAKAASDAAAKAAASAASNAAGNAASGAASSAASSAASGAASNAASSAASGAASSAASSSASGAASGAASSAATPPPPPPPPPPASSSSSSPPPAGGGSSSSGGESSSSSSGSSGSSSSSSSGENKGSGGTTEQKSESKTESKTEEKKTESKTEEKKEESKTEEKKSDEKKSDEKKSDDKKEEKKSEDKKKEDEKKKKEEEKKKKAEVTNPLLLASDITMAESTPGKYLASISLGVSKSSLMGDESYSGGLVVNSNLSSIVTTGGYTKMGMKSDGQLDAIHSYGTAFAYLAGNYMNLLGYTWIKPTPKHGTYGYNVGVINLFLKNDNGGFDYNMASSAIVFWTKPYVYSKKLTISPQVFTMFSPIAWNSVTGSTTINRHAGFLLGASFDYKLSKRFGFSFNYKLSGNTKAGSEFLNNFLIGSRMVL